MGEGFFSVCKLLGPKVPLNFIEDEPHWPCLLLNEQTTFSKTLSSGKQKNKSASPTLIDPACDLPPVEHPHEEHQLFVLNLFGLGSCVVFSGGGVGDRSKGGQSIPSDTKLFRESFSEMMFRNSGWFLGALTPWRKDIFKKFWVKFVIFAIKSVLEFDSVSDMFWPEGTCCRHRAKYLGGSRKTFIGLLLGLCICHWTHSRRFATSQESLSKDVISLQVVYTLLFSDISWKLWGRTQQCANWAHSKRQSSETSSTFPATLWGVFSQGRRFSKNSSTGHLKLDKVTDSCPHSF